MDFLCQGFQKLEVIDRQTDICEWNEYHAAFEDGKNTRRWIETKMLLRAAVSIQHYVGTADAWSAFNQRPPTDRYVGARRGLVLSMRATFNAANGTSTIIKSSLGLKSRAFCHFRSVYQNFVTVFAHDTYSKTGTSRRRLLLSMRYTAKEACPRAPRKQFDNVNASAH